VEQSLYESSQCGLLLSPIYASYRGVFRSSALSCATPDLSTVFSAAEGSYLWTCLREAWGFQLLSNLETICVKRKSMYPRVRTHLNHHAFRSLARPRVRDMQELAKLGLRLDSQGTVRNPQTRSCPPGSEGLTIFASASVWRPLKEHARNRQIVDKRPYKASPI